MTLDIIISLVLVLVSATSFAIIEVCLWKFDHSVFRKKNKPFWDSHHEPESDKKVIGRYPVTAHHIFKTVGVASLFGLPFFHTNWYILLGLCFVWTITMSVSYRVMHRKIKKITNEKQVQNR